jgi:hypothetical protein
MRAAWRRCRRITRQGSSSLPTSTTGSRSLTCSFVFAKHRLGGLGPCWVRDGVGVGVLQPVGEPLELVREQMPIAVQRHGRRGMAELSLDRLDARPLGDKQARAGVAKVMEPQPVGESPRATAGLKIPATNLCSRSGPPCGAVNTRSWGPCGRSANRRRAARRGSAAEARCGEHRSWSAPHQPPIHLGRRLANLAATTEQVQVPDTKRRQLAGAKPGVAGKPHQQPIARVDGGGQFFDLPGGQEVHVPPDDARQPDPSGRVAGDSAALHPGRQDLGEHLMGVTDPGGDRPCSTSPAIHSRTASVSISPRLARAKAGRIWLSSSLR